MKKQWKFLLYTTAVLCMSVSCKKEAPDPNDEGAISCGSFSEDWVLVRIVQDEVVDFQGSGIVFKNPFTMESFPNLLRRGTFTCEFSLAKLNGFEETVFTTNADYENPPGKYRIWGRIFWARDVINITGERILSTQIDRIERNK